MKKIYTIKIDYVETRLDRWFRKNISQVPQSLIEKNLRKGNIKVNNKKIKSSYKLQKNDQIILYNIVFSGQKNVKSNNYYKANKKDLSYSSKIFSESYALCLNNTPSREMKFVDNLEFKILYIM